MMKCQGFVEFEESAVGLRVYNGMMINYNIQTCQIDAGAVFALVVVFMSFVTAWVCYRIRLVRLRDETVNPKLELVYRKTIQYRPKHVAIQPAGSRQQVEIPQEFKMVMKC
jgi:hypothetical protein